MVITVPLFLVLAGGAIYLVSNNAKGAELARIAYFVGLLWLVYSLAGHTWRF